MPKSNEAPIGLFFEVAPNPGHLNHYFSYVEKLKPELEKHDGLIWLNRYRAQLDDYSLLSHQLWDSEKSLENWRQNKQHRLAQKAGIKKHFKDYRIRIGQRLACWQADLVTDANFDSISKSDALLVSIQSRAVISNTAFNKYASLDGAYHGLSASDQFITLVTPNDLSSVLALTSSISPGSIDKIELFLISRDYSMTDRIQAPRDS
ncbi:MAG: antibiotic biosynthesis monooxygenase [Proteobacteria bacterium]|jgi:heme-degrading monooxygenase HmoA|nr:antibiotic biosynthesis monooxygenase [Pseudomonadota bacterium]MDA1149264.1 antibiotic biosynthesis monooxygenase [Pseudomonadota bacterium]MDP4632812.1 antibiotic biosynthesis monooxygenase [Porticoccaceae bacterium]